MDRNGTTATNPVSFARVLFNAFSELRRPESHSSANLDSFDSQSSLPGLDLEMAGSCVPRS
jgi:hypothetical protein